MPLWVKYTSIQIISQYCVNEIEVLIRYMYDTLTVGPTVIHLAVHLNQHEFIVSVALAPQLCSVCVKHLSLFV